MKLSACTLALLASMTLACANSSTVRPMTASTDMEARRESPPEAAPSTQVASTAEWKVAVHYDMGGPMEANTGGANVSFWIESRHAGMVIVPSVLGRFTVYIGWSMPTEAVNTMTVSDDFRVELFRDGEEPLQMKPDGLSGGGALLCFSDFTGVDPRDVAAVRVSYRERAEWVAMAR